MRKKCPKRSGLTPLPAVGTMPRAGWQGLLSSRRPALFRERTHADRQSTRAQGPEAAGPEEQDSRAGRLAPEARRLHARVHDDAEEAELGAPEGRPCPADE